MFKKYLNYLLKEYAKSKIIKAALCSAVLSILIISAILFVYWPRDFSHDQKPTLGVTFSQKYAQELNLDWREAYLAILNEIQPAKIRLAAHWDLIEPRQGQFRFGDLDWQIKEAADRGVEIILAIGRRTPRWPECHDPEWLAELDKITAEKRVLIMLEQVVNHYKKNPAISVWQVENEPLLDVFGKCPPGDVNFLEREIVLVKLLDSRPVMLTDSGELSTWRHIGARADILGTSLYKTVWNRWWGFFTYPFPVGFYYYKAKFVRRANPNLRQVIVSELQGEAWSGIPLISIPIKDQLNSMNALKLSNIVTYATHTGLSEIYLWGVEWWYWLKINNVNEMWDEARRIFRD